MIRIYGSNVKIWESYRKFREVFTGHIAKMENLTVMCKKIYGPFYRKWKSYRNDWLKITGQISKNQNLTVMTG